MYNNTISAIKGYEASYIERCALNRIKRDGKEYKRASSWIFETTGSCELKEAISWVVFYMEQAFSFNGEPITDVIHSDFVIIKDKNDAAAMWLAAYDYYTELVR